jgi:predicted nucleotide-binding protein (sugar kinase/HSP70/actin superfamily)
LLARDKMTSAPGALRYTPARGAEQVGTYVPEPAETAGRSGFRGYDLSKVDYSLREFTCKGCSNTCQIQEFTVETEKTYWGDKCSDRFRKVVKNEQKPVIEDLFALRQRLLMDESDLPAVAPNAPTVGIPLTMFAIDSLPFWRTMLAGCGFRTVLSEPTNKQIAQAGLETAVAEPCFPIIAAHGHVVSLAKRDDVQHILLPNIISMETPWMDNESHLCPWHQTLPFVCRQAPALQAHGQRFLSPRVRFREGIKTVTDELQQCLCKMGVSRRTVAAAVQAGYQAQERFNSQFQAAGRKAISLLRQTGAKGLVLLGRPYNLHDAGMNLAIPRKLRDYYGINCIPLDCIETDSIDVRDTNCNMYWALGRRVLAAAKIVADNPNLHILYITNFKCGPDSFIKHFIRPASGKPFLTLQFDGHSNDAGAMTRCEAYLDSIGVLRPWRAEQITASLA